jgi:hypothetical protein
MAAATAPAKAKRGRPRKTPTPVDLAKIERLAGLGCRLDEIAIACDVSPATLDRWKQRDDVSLAYQKGRIEAKANVAERLYDLAMDGDVAAAIFWLKSQAGWTDRPQPESVDRAQVVVYIPDNGR